MIPFTTHLPMNAKKDQLPGKLCTWLSITMMEMVSSNNLAVKVSQMRKVTMQKKMKQNLKVENINKVTCTICYYRL